MLTICDTHIMVYWADQPERLSAAARGALDRAMEARELACSDISLWEIAMLHARGRLNNQANVAPGDYIDDILAAMTMTVLPITSEIAVLAQSAVFPHGDPADKLIGATALIHRAPLISIDEKLRAVAGLRCIW